MDATIHQICLVFKFPFPYLIRQGIEKKKGKNLGCSKRVIRENKNRQTVNQKVHGLAHFYGAYGI